VPLATYVELQNSYLDAVEALLDTQSETLEAGLKLQQLTGLELDYSTQQQGQWHVTADRGRMPSDRGSLQLQGNVRVEGAAQNDLGRAIIRTEELAYDTRANVVQTAAPVTVEIGPHELRGRGLRVGLNEGTLRLESNVHGQFKP
jgi:LPS export ABC transporter protein LptC